MDDDVFELREMLARRCAVCERELAEGEERVILPAYVQERDAYVRDGMADQRIACVECAMSLKHKEKTRMHTTRASEEKRVMAFLRMLQ